jgi:pimeloyl-ACP methyl ester carboxylesterase
VLGALVFAVDSVIVPLPAAAADVAVRYVPDAGFQERERADAETRVAQRVGRQARPILNWRAYVGSNTLVLDGFARAARNGWHRIQLAPLGPSVLVGKMIFAAHRRLPGERSDFTAARRRRGAEHSDAATTAACVDIRDASGLKPDIVVAVHGTMACAVGLASKLRPLVTPPEGVDGWPLVRYEHDTWQPIESNARELADRLVALGVERAVLVGHSRGGLVIRHAAELAQAAKPGLWIRIVTLGTPFAGTPYVGAARTSLLGGRALLGALRLATGAVAIDVPTRLAGLLILGGLPRGIAAMDVGSDYFSGFAHRPPSATSTVAGDIDPTGPDDAFGLGLLRGMATSAFEGQENDLVVSTESARGKSPDTLTVTSDHFSYLCQAATLDAIAAAIREAEAERHAKWLDATDASKGLSEPMSAPTPLRFKKSDGTSGTRTDT